MQLLVPRYLEFSFGKFVEEQQKLREHVKSTMGGAMMGGAGGQLFEAVEEQTRKNMAIFTQAFSLFNPFGINAAAKAGEAGSAETPASTPAPAAETGGAADIDVLKQQLNEMQRQLEAISKR
jgi:polyhydroxyalkanoate synthesis regulator protein